MRSGSLDARQLDETVEESIARQMVLKGAAKGAGEMKAKFYEL
jgi:hypothetical protein